MRRVLLYFVICFSVFAANVEYTILRGWNLISLPCLVEASAPEAIFPCIPPLYSFNPVTGAYEALTAMPTTTDGFWLLSDRDTLLDLSCSSPWSDDTASDPPETSSFLLFQPEVVDTAIFTATRLGDGFCIVASIAEADSTASIGRDLAFIAVDDSGLPTSGRRYNVERAAAVGSTPDGGYVVVGKVADVSGEIFVMRTDSLGIPIWAKQLEFSVSAEQIFALTLVDTTHIILVGTTLLHLSDDGELLWCKGLTISAFALMNAHEGFAIMSRSTVTTEESFFTVSRFHVDGTLSLSRTFTTSTALEFVTGIVETATNEFYIVGESTIPHSSTVLLKVSDELGVDWVRMYDIAGRSIANRHILWTEDGLLIAGESSGDPFIAAFTDDGEPEWSWAFIGSLLGPDDYERAVSVFQGTEGYVLSGLKGFYDAHPSIFSTTVGETGENCLRLGLELTSSAADPVFTVSTITVDVMDMGMSLLDILIDNQVLDVNAVNLCR